MVCADEVLLNDDLYDDKMVAVLKDSVDVPILYCSSLMIQVTAL